MKRLSLLLVSLVASLSACADGADEDVVVAQGAIHAWGNYHWARTGNPFTVRLGDGLAAAWDPYLVTTAADWSASSVLDTTIVAGTGRRNCPAVAGRVEVCNSRYGNNGWLGIASIWAMGDHITQATVKLNDTYFGSATYNKPAWKNLVMCQEVGHAFGLAHQDENTTNSNLGSCMDYTNNPETNQHPNAHDYEQLEIIYAHFDTSSTLAVSAQAAAASRAEEAREWGALVASSGGGRKETYVRREGGLTVVSEVFWAE